MNFSIQVPFHQLSLFFSSLISLLFSHDLFAYILPCLTSIYSPSSPSMLISPLFQFFSTPLPLLLSAFQLLPTLNPRQFLLRIRPFFLLTLAITRTLLCHIHPTIHSDPFPFPFTTFDDRLILNYLPAYFVPSTLILNRHKY